MNTRTFAFLLISLLFIQVLQLNAAITPGNILSTPCCGFSALTSKISNHFSCQSFAAHGIQLPPCEATQAHLWQSILQDPELAERQPEPNKRQWLLLTLGIGTTGTMVGHKLLEIFERRKKVTEIQSVESKKLDTKETNPIEQPIVPVPAINISTQKISIPETPWWKQRYIIPTESAIGAASLGYLWKQRYTKNQAPTDSRPLSNKKEKDQPRNSSGSDAAASNRYPTVPPLDLSIIHGDFSGSDAAASSRSSSASPFSASNYLEMQRLGINFTVNITNGHLTFATKEDERKFINYLSIQTPRPNQPKGPFSPSVNAETQTTSTTGSLQTTARSSTPRTPAASPATPQPLRTPATQPAALPATPATPATPQPMANDLEERIKSINSKKTTDALRAELGKIQILERKLQTPDRLLNLKFRLYDNTRRQEYFVNEKGLEKFIGALKKAYNDKYAELQNLKRAVSIQR